MRELYELIHNSYEIDTVEKLLSKPTSIFFGVALTDFIYYQDHDHKSNLDYIYESYSPYELAKFGQLPYKLLPLKCGVKLTIPKAFANVSSSQIEGDFQAFSYEEVAFKAKMLTDLEANREYSYMMRPQSDSTQLGSSGYRIPKCKVLIFSRYYGQFIDVSKFITSCQISNTSSSGGNFNLGLSPITCQIDADGFLKTPSAVTMKGDYVSFDHLYSIKRADSSVGGYGITSDQNLVRNVLYFSKIISPNDLILIAFEKFKFERDDYTDSFFIDRSYTDRFIYDLIGLVDSVQEQVSANGNEASVSVSGRDMSKLLIEEGSYFFPSNLAFDAIQIKDSQGRNPLRLPHTGEIFYLMAQSYKSIEDVLKFIFNQLLIINPLPDTFFKAGEKRSLISLILIAIERNVANRRIIDSSLASMSGSLLNFIQKICQYPFVEFIQDTYQNRFHFMVRVPPISPELIKSSIAGSYIDEYGINTFAQIIAVDASSVVEDTLQINDSQVYTWFQLSPTGLLPSMTEEISFTFLPAIGFQEYIDQWGSRPLQLSYNYLNYSYQDKHGSPDKLSIVEEQAYKDFKFILDSHLYLPFTRSGTITLHMDRRLKIGNWFYYQPTGEIFMIDAVSHNYNVQNLQSSTTVQVSRGMIRKFVFGHDVDGIGKVSYFNIVNTNLQFVYKKEKREVKTSSNSTIIGGSIKESKTSAAFVTKGSDQMVEYLKTNYEKFSAKRYKDGQNILLGGKIVTQLYSIGYGHQILPSELSKYDENYTMTVAEASKLYRKDLSSREYIVNSVFGPYLFGSEFDALLSITYNIAFSAQGLRTKYPGFVSVIKQYLTARTQENASKARSEWLKTALTSNINGKSVYQPGLKSRRQSESGRFLTYVGYNLKEETQATVHTSTETISYEMVDVLDRNRVFQDVKVNQDIFEFFLRNRQFDGQR